MEEIEGKVLKLLAEIGKKFDLQDSDAWCESMALFNDQEKLRIFGKCMDECGLKFLSYLVEDENGRR